jgi:RNA polymerase sigma-70 factor, ECF subfamily
MTRLDNARREAQWRTWMAAGLAGDAVAYRALLEDIARRLRTVLARRFDHSAAELEDIVQESLLAIHLKRHTWVPGELVGPWIVAIARHKAIDALRRRGRRAEWPIEDLEFVDPQTSPEENAREGHDLSNLLDRLDDRQRAIVKAVSLEGLSTREAAARLSMTEGALRVALHRSLKRLAAMARGEKA